MNPLALEELGALEERHRFLEEQVEDVRRARRELHQVIRAVDDEIMRVFAQAFADVNEHFQVLVATLFPGGTGRLSLTDPTDLLDTGVEVEARPAGKNVRKLSLLSGGERSLVALAFLFAVFRSRPSPFYLIDEVEAALDDVNLHRFLDLLHEFRERGPAHHREPPEADHGGGRRPLRRDHDPGRLVQGGQPEGAPPASDAEPATAPALSDLRRAPVAPGTGRQLGCDAMLVLWIVLAVVVVDPRRRTPRRRAAPPADSTSSPAEAHRPPPSRSAAPRRLRPSSRPGTGPRPSRCRGRRRARRRTGDRGRSSRRGRSSVEAEAEAERQPSAAPARAPGADGQDPGPVLGVRAGPAEPASVDDQTWDDLEEALLRADVGVATTTALLDDLRPRVRER